MSENENTTPATTIALPVGLKVGQYHKLSDAQKDFVYNRALIYATNGEWESFSWADRRTIGALEKAGIVEAELERPYRYNLTDKGKMVAREAWFARHFNDGDKADLDKAGAIIKADKARKDAEAQAKRDAEVREYDRLRKRLDDYGVNLPELSNREKTYGVRNPTIDLDDIAKVLRTRRERRI